MVVGQVLVTMEGSVEQDEELTVPCEALSLQVAQAALAEETDD